jgi:hypothetical protein
MTADLSDYIADHYGTCTSNLCKCLFPGHSWLGRACPNWRPVKAKTWEELYEHFAERHLPR